MTETMQDSGIEWIGAIPTGWQLDRLKDIVSLRDEKSTEKSEDEDYLELEDLEQGTGRLLSIRNTLEVGSAVMKFYKNDVLFGKLRPYLQKYHLAKFDGKCTGEILAFKPERITPEFLLYFIASDGFIKICTAMSYGAKMPRVNYPKQLASLPVCLPKVPEQQAIAHYLDERCGKLDSIITIKKQQIQTLDALRQSIIYQAVTKGLDDSVELVDSGVEWLGEIPKGWRKYRIKDVATFSPNYSEEKPELFELCTVVPMENVSAKGEIDVSTLQEYEAITKGLTFFENGDVIFAKITPCMENGKGAFVTNLPTKYAFGSTEFHVLRSSFRINGKFLYYYTYCKTFRDYAAENMTGAAGQKRVSTNFLKYTVIHLPDISEQQKIVNYLDDETQRLEELKANLTQQIGVLLDYKKSLIYECVTGKKHIFKAG